MAKPRVLVVASGRNRDAQQEFARRVKEGEDDLVVALANAQHFGRTDPVKDYEHVYHDGTSAAVVEACEGADVPHSVFLADMESVPRAAMASAPRAVEPPPLEADADGRDVQVVRRGPWFTLYVDGEKVGKAKKSHEEALAQLVEA